MRQRARGIIEAVTIILVLGLLPFILYTYAGSRLGIPVAGYGIRALLLSLPIAALALLKNRFGKGDERRLVLACAQVVSVSVWIFVSFAPTFTFTYSGYDISITVLRFLLLAAAGYCLNLPYAYVEYRLHRPSGRAG